MSKCIWCGERIWFWQKWECTPTPHSEMITDLKDLESRGQICEPFPQSEAKGATG